MSTSGAAEDPYLAGLQDEAQKLESLGQAQKEQKMLEKQNAPVPKKKSLQQTSTDDGRAQFESELRQYSAGYGLYQKLNARDRELVFREYVKAPPNRRHAAAIQKTIDLSIGK